MRVYMVATVGMSLLVMQAVSSADFERSTEKVGNGRVNWGAGYIEARGEGAYPPNASQGQARLMARRAAIADAQRNLLETVNGVRLTAETRVRNFIVESDAIATRVEGILKNATVVSEKDKGNTYEVVMRAPMGSITALAIEASQAPERFDLSQEQVDAILSPPAEVTIPSQPPRPRPQPPTIRPNPSKPYTGVIIDARGLDLRPCMCPKIRREDGSEVWGTLNVSPELAIEYGIAAWLRDTKDLEHPAIRKRIGDNPMFLRAVGVAGAGRGDAVLKADDAQRLLEANQQNRFLEKLAVVFLY
jgi:hypothetical protein